MYTGRILSVGINSDGNPFVAYRVSSRSFPNRQCLENNKGGTAVVPKEGFEKDIFKNTYIAYNCILFSNDVAIVSNGSQTDVIADKISLGMNLRDALAYGLLTMDFEKDEYNTPRIAGVIDAESREAYVGIVSDSKILVEKVSENKAVFISTYGSQVPDEVDFAADNAGKAAKFIFDEGIFKEYEKPVTSTAAIFDGKWTFDVYNP